MNPKFSQLSSRFSRTFRTTEKIKQQTRRHFPLRVSNPRRENNPDNIVCKLSVVIKFTPNNITRLACDSDAGRISRTVQGSGSRVQVILAVMRLFKCNKLQGGSNGDKPWRGEGGQTHEFCNGINVLFARGPLICGPQPAKNNANPKFLIKDPRRSLGKHRNRFRTIYDDRVSQKCVHSGDN